MQTVPEEQITVARKLPGRRYDKVFFGCIVVLLLLIVSSDLAAATTLPGSFAHI
jgi:hypothetical protein